MAPKAANGKLPMMPAPSPQRPKREPKASEGDSNSQSGSKREAEDHRPKRVVKPKVIKEADMDEPKRRHANQYTVGRAKGGPSQRSPSRLKPRAPRNRLPLDPLLLYSRAGAEWGWKGCLPPDQPLNPLYYGCPERWQYYCCERHRCLWQGGKLQTELPMPEEWKLSAEEPAFVAENEEKRKRGETPAPRAVAPSAKEQDPKGATAAVGLASWVRVGPGEEGEEEDGEEEEGEEEQGGEEDA